jgi:hypothetical protein
MHNKHRYPTMPHVPGNWPGNLPGSPWAPASYPFVSSPRPADEEHPLFKRIKERMSAIGLGQRNALAPKRTHMLFLLDQSLSMLRGRDVTMAGFNDQVAMVTEQHAGLGDATVSLLLFNDSVTTRYAFAHPSRLERLSEATYRPHNDTALYDALGQSMDLLSQAEGFAEENTAFFVSVFTDGDENASRHCGGTLISKLITMLEATGRVTFAFMGPREGLKSIADVLALAPGNIAGYDPSSIAGRTEAFNSMSSATATYMMLRSQGMSATRNLYAKDDLAPKI